VRVAFHDAGAEDRQFVVLVRASCSSLDQMTATLDELALHLALDEQDITFRIMRRILQVARPENRRRPSSW